MQGHASTLDTNIPVSGMYMLWEERMLQDLAHLDFLEHEGARYPKKGW